MWSKNLDRNDQEESRTHVHVPKRQNQNPHTLSSELPQTQNEPPRTTVVSHPSHQLSVDRPGSPFPTTFSFSRIPLDHAMYQP